MRSIALVPLFLQSVFATEYLVGVGKDETTGKKGIGFDPSVITPVAGDVIAFEFRSGAHSVVQTNYFQPCVTLEGGFNSGVFNVDDSLAVDASGLPVVRLTVNDTNPLWFFDQASGQCQQGAVLAVNPTSIQTSTIFKNNAKTSPVTPTTSDAASSTTGAAASSSSASQNNSASHAKGADFVYLAGLGATLALFIGL